MLNTFRDLISQKICNLAFWYDLKYLNHLDLDDDKWPTLDKLKWKFFNLLYRLGCFIGT
tara:strand:- start:94 stop:270 length:177 start_codon:yes stop_codon:yes gene_type:complete